MRSLISSRCSVARSTSTNTRHEVPISTLIWRARPIFAALFLASSLACSAPSRSGLFEPLAAAGATGAAFGIGSKDANPAGAAGLGAGGSSAGASSAVADGSAAVGGASSSTGEAGASAIGLVSAASGGGGDLIELPDAGAPPLLDAGDAGTQRDAGDGGGSRAQLTCAPSDRADCNALVTALRHRYRFGGTGTNAVDDVARASGRVVQAQLSGTGGLDLPGNGAYVDLPNGIVSALGSATFEVWLDWAGGDIWQRIFDFGSTTNGREDEPGSGSRYLFLTPRAGGDVLRVAFRSPDVEGEVQVNGKAALPSGVEEHVAVVLDAQQRTLALYQDGSLVGSTSLPSSLAGLDDVNNWLGRSQFADDPALSANLLEFRIYGAALSAEQIALSFELGPDAPLTP